MNYSMTSLSIWLDFIGCYILSLDVSHKMYLLKTAMSIKVIIIDSLHIVCY